MTAHTYKCARARGLEDYKSVRVSTCRLYQSARLQSDDCGVDPVYADRTAYAAIYRVIVQQLVNLFSIPISNVNVDVHLADFTLGYSCCHSCIRS